MDEIDYAQSLFHQFLQIFYPCFIIFFVSRNIYLRFIQKKNWIKENNQKLEETKTQIAFEMHKDIGNDLNVLLVKINSWNTKNNIGETPEFTQLENSTRNVIFKINEIVWSLKTEKVTLESFTSYLTEYTKEILGNSKIKLDLQIATVIPNKEIEVNFKRNIFLVYKEAMNNVIKHAHCSQIKIEIKFVNGTYLITIIDNGIGFKINSIIKGNGLDNMENRINLLNGKLEIVPYEPKGTVVKFAVKI